VTDQWAALHAQHGNPGVPGCPLCPAEIAALRADRDRLAAALGRVEALCDLREPHGRRPHSWVYIADLRRALSDAPTTEGPTT
jgi:hypothetical protein